MLKLSGYSLLSSFSTYTMHLKVVKLPDITAAIVAMSVCYGAYMGEIFRAGIQAIPKGQMEAALALGLGRGQAIRRIILPTVRLILLAHRK